MKDAYYFKHDSNARHDPKIKALINKYGVEGYGRYWIIIENLRDQSNYKLNDKQYTWDALAQEFCCTSEKSKEFVKDCIEKFDLLEDGDGFFYSMSLMQRMQELDDLRLKRKHAADVRWGNE